MSRRGWSIWDLREDLRWLARAAAPSLTVLYVATRLVSLASAQPATAVRTFRLDLHAVFAESFDDCHPPAAQQPNTQFLGLQRFSLNWDAQRGIYTSRMGDCS